MGTPEEEFNVIQFEKRLTQLKDSQDHINICCKWCLENRQHHKKIVISWLNVLKRVKIEQRVNLFYLANDVIQYSKRRRYDFVESWGTALQKATTLVRDEKVKHKIIRIFNIWQQRGVYNEEFISDLCGLISVVPTASKNDEPHEFQASYVINKIKQCAKLENDTDLKLKTLKEDNPKIQIEPEALCTSLKDRAHVDDVEKELEVYVKHLEGYINALKAEIKCRIANISVLKQANTHLDKDKKDVKLIANAYKLFGNKIKVFQKKLEEHRSGMTSPVPSPDVNAPSPGPDCDIDLPEDQENNKTKDSFKTMADFTAGYYNPVPAPVVTEEDSSFVSNGYASFIGANFNMHDLTAGSFLSSNTQNEDLAQVANSYGDSTDALQNLRVPPPPPVKAQEQQAYQYPGGGHMPLLPPPMPPFGPKSDYENSYGGSYGTNKSFDEYNPEQELETWETDTNWNPELDTPESPPIFEKEGYVEGAEYHDNVVPSGIADVDHRVLQLANPNNLARGRGQDVDHRNLISLTGSPGDSNSTPSQETWSNPPMDQDYRQGERPAIIDQDYRLPPSQFSLEQLKLPPPPPPPNQMFSSPKKANNSSRKMLDNVESIDMDLSEDEQQSENFHERALKPPPPLPDLPDDVDANSFLDEFENELNSGDFTVNLQDPDRGGYMEMLNTAMPPPPPSLLGHPPRMFAPPNWNQQVHSNNNNNNNNFRGRNHGHRRGGRNRGGGGRGGGGGNFVFRGNGNYRGRGHTFPSSGRAPLLRLPRSRGGMRGRMQK